MVSEGEYRAARDRVAARLTAVLEAVDAIDTGRDGTVVEYMGKRWPVGEFARFLAGPLLAEAEVEPPEQVDDPAEIQARIDGLGPKEVPS